MNRKKGTSETCICSGRVNVARIAPRTISRVKWDSGRRALNLRPSAHLSSQLCLAGCSFQLLRHSLLFKIRAKRSGVVPTLLLNTLKK